MSLSKDFETFKKEVSWFIKAKTEIDLSETDIRLSVEFQKTFPILTLLIQTARATLVVIDQQEYTLFAWDRNDGAVCGWLNRIDDRESYFCDLISEHELLIRNIGGIRETFNSPEDSFSNNQNFMFLGAESSYGIGTWEEYYEDSCTYENCKPIDHLHFIAFAEEANGALTMYDPATAKVMLFSHDHCFDNVSSMDGQPIYTFHTFEGVESFVDYVEELAKQWRNLVVN